jgi:hypothetical protein
LGVLTRPDPESAPGRHASAISEAERALLDVLRA